MHLLKHNKAPKAKPFIPIRNIFDIPDHRLVRGKRYAVGGKYLHDVGPKRRADPVQQKALLEAQKAARTKQNPEDTKPFDLDSFTPSAGRILLARPPLIRTEGGVLLPEEKWKTESWLWVVKVGAGVDQCAPGDRVIFQKNHRPKTVWLGEHKFLFARQSGLAALLDGPAITVEQIIHQSHS